MVAQQLLTLKHSKAESDRFKQAFEEAKEEIGYRLFPFVEQFVDLIVSYALNYQEFAKFFSNT